MKTLNINTLFIISAVLSMITYLKKTYINDVNDINNKRKLSPQEL